MVTRIIAKTLGPVLATAEDIPHGGLYVIDRTLLPRWSWKGRTSPPYGRANTSAPA